MEITKSPRCFGQHFIDCAGNLRLRHLGRWRLELPTDLGRAMLAELKSAKEA